MKRAVRIGLWLGLGVTVALGVLLISAALVLRSNWFQDQLRTRVIRTAAITTGSRVELANLRFDWQRLEAHLEGFTLWGHNNGAEAPLLTTTGIHTTFGINWSELLEDPVLLKTLTIDRPHIYLYVNESGITNLPRPQVSSDGSFMENLVRLAIGRLEVNDGIAEWNHRPVPFALQASDTRLKVHYDGARPGYVGDLTAGTLQVQAEGVPAERAAVDAKVAIEADRLEVLESQVAGDGFRVSAQGLLSDFTNPQGDFSGSASVGEAALRRLPVSRVVSNGAVDFEGRFQFGPDRAPSFDGSVGARQVRFSGFPSQSPALNVSALVQATPDRIELSNIQAAAGTATLEGSGRILALEKLEAEGTVKGATLQQVLRSADLNLTPLDASISGAVRLSAEFRPAGRLNIAGDLTLSPLNGESPLQGRVAGSFTRDRGLMFDQVSVTTPHSRLEASGSPSRQQPLPGLSVDLETEDARQLLALVPALEEAAQDLPVDLAKQSLRLSGRVTGDWTEPVIQGQLSAEQVRLRDTTLDRLNADFSLASDALQLRSFRVEQGALEVRGQGGIRLEAWRQCDECRLDGLATLTRLPLERLLRELHIDVPLAGRLSADVTASGVLAEPNLAARVQVEEGSLMDQPFEHLRARLALNGRVLQIESSQTELAGGRVEASGTIRFAADSWERAQASLNLKTSPVQISGIRALSRALNGAQGTVSAEARVQASINGRNLQIEAIDGEARLPRLTLGTAEGNATLNAQTQGQNLLLTVRGAASGATLAGEARCTLRGDYPCEGKADFSEFTLSDLRTLLERRLENDQFRLDGEVRGGVTFAGSLTNSDSWKAEAKLDRLVLNSAVRAGDSNAAITIRNRDQVRASLQESSLHIQPFQMIGPGTDLRVSGSLPLANGKPLDLKMDGSINLSLLRNFEPTLEATGVSTLAAQLRGTYAQPDLNGRLILRDASFFVRDLPNGLDRANGLVIFNGTRANIEALTANTGGGRLTLTGYVGFGGEQLDYRLRARANEVRVRYPEGISTTVNADLSFSGTLENSLLSGDVTILRAVLNPRLDLASLLAESGQPMVTSSGTNPLLRGMRFDVQINSADNARFETSLAREIQAEVDQRLRGSPQNPVVLGNVSITQGEINFFGNRYVINRGEISFVNPVKIEPVLNLDLQTRIRAVEVNMTFTGPINRLNVNYRSDPPLQLSEIVALLATGRAPTTDPANMARQEIISQSYGQVGASALIGQALTSPVSSRLQRFFGLSRIRLNPQLAGFNSEPQGRLTLEQQISQDVVLIFTTNLTRGSQQSALVEWDFSREWLVIGGREENGLYGVDFLFRKRF